MPKTDLHSWRRRLHPKLRMICNGDAEVNQRRAEVAPCLVSRKQPPEPLAMATEIPGDVRSGKLSRPKLKEVPSDVVVNVYLESQQPSSVATSTVQGSLGVARLPLRAVSKLAEDDNITYIQPAETIKFPRPFVTSAGSRLPDARNSSGDLAALRSKHQNGRGVLIGIIDVDGFDFEHPDFLVRSSGGLKNSTRFLSIWDQGAEPGPRSDDLDGMAFNVHDFR